MKDDRLISLNAAIDALWHSIEDECGELQSYAEAVISDAEDAIKALPSPPGCEDAVSRDALDILIEEAQTAWLRGDILLMYPALKKGLKKVPPVTPKQPGWIPVTEPQKGEENR